MIVKFYLKNPTAKKQGIIYLNFSYNGQRLQTSAGMSIASKDWDKKRAFPKTQIMDYPEYKEHLDKVQNIVWKYYLEEKNKGIIPDPNSIKQHLASQLNKKNITQKGINDFEHYYAEYLSYKQRAEGTIKILKGSLKELVEFTQLKKIELTFKNINRPFYEQYIKYLLEKKNNNSNCLNTTGYVNDTISKRMSCIRNYMSWSAERNYHNNTEYLVFKWKKAKKNENIVLSSEEFEKLRNCNLSYNKRLERVRDLFLFGIYTGQRWSDIAKFKKEDLVGDTWKFVAHKTKTKIIEVPFGGFNKGLKILKKYDYELPKISPQKFNDYLKELGEYIGLKTEVVLRRFSGEREIQLRYPKYELMSSHMARRTCVTLMLECGIPPTTVMVLTGHSDINTLLKYVNTSTEVLKTSLIEMEKQWEKKVWNMN